jgi:hypothetical protein
VVERCIVDHARAGTRVTMISRPVPRRRPRNPRGFGPEHR